MCFRWINSSYFTSSTCPRTHVKNPVINHIWKERSETDIPCGDRKTSDLIISTLPLETPCSVASYLATFL